MKHGKFMKKMLGILLCLSLVLSLGAMPAWAEETEDTETTAAQTVYDAYVALQGALESGEMSELKAAAEEFEAALESLNEMSESEEQMGELGALLEVDAEEAFFMILADWINANVILVTDELQQAYLDDPTVKTAWDLVSYYDVLVEDEETKALVESFIPDLDDVYSAAVADMPAEDVMAVYEAYVAVQFALESGMASELQTAAEDFEAVLDAFNELSEEQLGELGALLEVDAEEAFSMILADWINANVILETDELYQAYLEDPNAETAAAFVEYYDLLKEDEEIKAAVDAFFFDLEEVYSNAVADLPSDSTQAGDDDGEDDQKPTTGTTQASGDAGTNETKPTTGTTQASDDAGKNETKPTTGTTQASDNAEKDDSEVPSIPQTGETTNLLLWGLLLLVSGGVVAWTAYGQKKRANEN